MSYVDTMESVIGLPAELIAPAKGELDLCRSAGYWWPHTHFCMVSDRPCGLRRNAEGRLSSESAPAIEWRDGWKLWYIDGVRVDEQIVMKPQTQTVEQLDKEMNGDVRSIRLRRFGWTRYLKETGAKVLDRRDNEIENTKEALFRTARGDVVFVPVCPTGRVFGLPVPPGIQTCEQAQAWLAGDHRFRVLART